MMNEAKKPSERILEILNALKIIDGKEKETDLTLYEAKAIAIFLDEFISKLK